MLVDDHRIFRDGIRSLLSEYPGIEVIGEASSGQEALERLGQLMPDILILDVTMQDESGIDTAKKATAMYPGIRIMILSMHTDEEFVVDAVKAGVKGYLPKDTSREELLEALNTINDGGEYYGKLVSEQFMRGYVKKIRTDQPLMAKEDLTLRELEILKLSSLGLTSKEIGDKLFISSKTVDTHKSHILRKLKLRNAVEMVLYAVKHHLIEI